MEPDEFGLAGWVVIGFLQVLWVRHRRHVRLSISGGAVKVFRRQLSRFQGAEPGRGVGDDVVAGAEDCVGAGPAGRCDLFGADAVGLPFAFAAASGVRYRIRLRSP